MSLLRELRAFKRAAIACVAVVMFASHSVEAQTPVSVVWKTKMRFGKFSSNVDSGGDVIIDAVANTRTLPPQFTDFGGVWKRGKFQVLGDSKAYVIVTLPSSFTMANNSGAFTIEVENIHMDKTNPVRLSKAGKKTIFIGGTLKVLTNQKNRTYKNETFIIDVEYQ